MASSEQANEAMQDNLTEILSKRNVVGMGVGFKDKLGSNVGQESVVVLVQRKKPLEALQPEDVVPPEIGGIPTDVVEIGVLVAQRSPRERYRPTIPPGASMSHFQVGAGTLGAVLRHRRTGQRFLLSNNHVFANSNDAQQGDDILQPGALDGGRRPADTVATLAGFQRLAYIEDAPAPQPQPEPQPPGQPQPDPQPPTVPSDPPSASGGCDVVDAAVGAANVLAQAAGSSKRVHSHGLFESQAAHDHPIVAQQLNGATPAEVPMIASASLDNMMDAAVAIPQDPTQFTNELLEIGAIQGIKAPELGMVVAKMGRTTGYTEGRITLLNTTVNVQYDTMLGTRTARFVDQVITSGMSNRGDSGSLVVDPSDNFAVGLLFGGSDVASIFTPIDRILDAFELEF